MSWQVTICIVVVDKQRVGWIVRQCTFWKGWLGFKPIGRSRNFSRLIINTYLTLLAIFNTTRIRKVFYQFEEEGDNHRVWDSICQRDYLQRILTLSLQCTAPPSDLGVMTYDSWQVTICIVAVDRQRVGFKGWLGFPIGRSQTSRIRQRDDLQAILILSLFLPQNYVIAVSL